MILELHIPNLKTVSLLNMREHWRATAQRKKDHRDTLRWMLAPHAKPELPVEVLFTRVSSGTLDEHDNLPSAFKHCVDQVAEWLGVDDSDSRVQWRYAQKKSKRGVYGVILRVKHVEDN